MEEVVNPRRHDDVSDIEIDESTDPRELIDIVLELQMRTQVQSLITSYCDHLNVTAGLIDEPLSVSTTGGKTKKTHVVPIDTEDTTLPFHPLKNTVNQLISVIKEYSVSNIKNIDGTENNSDTQYPYIVSPDYTKIFTSTLDPNQRDYVDALLRTAASQKLVDYLEECGYSLNLRPETWGATLNDPMIKKQIQETKDRLSKEFLLLAILYTVQLRDDQAPLIESVILGKTAHPGELHENLISGKTGIFPEMHIGLDDTRNSHKEEILEHVQDLNRIDSLFRKEYHKRITEIRLPGTASMVLDWNLPCIIDPQMRGLLKDCYTEYTSETNDDPDTETLLQWLNKKIQGDSPQWDEFVDYIVEHRKPEEEKYIRDTLEFSRNIQYFAKHLTKLFTKSGPHGLLTANVISRPDIIVINHDTETVTDTVMKTTRMSRNQNTGSSLTKRGIFISGNEMLNDVLSWYNSEFRPWQRRTRYEPRNNKGFSTEYQISNAKTLDALLEITGLFTNTEGKNDLLRDIRYEDIAKISKGRISQPLWQQIWEHVLLPELPFNLPETCTPQHEQSTEEALSAWAMERATTYKEKMILQRNYYNDLKSKLLQLTVEESRMENKQRYQPASEHDVAVPAQLQQNQPRESTSAPINQTSTNGHEEPHDLTTKNLTMREEINKITQAIDKVERQLRSTQRNMQYYNSIADQFNNTSFAALPLITLLRLSQSAAERIVQRYTDEGGRIPGGYDIRFIECKIPKPYEKNIQETLSQAKTKEGHRQQMVSRIALGTVRQIGQPVDEWYRSFLGLNILLNGNLVKFSSDIIIFPSWEVDSVKETGNDTDNFKIIRHEIFSGNPFGYYKWMKTLKTDLLLAIERWLQQHRTLAQSSKIVK